MVRKICPICDQVMRGAHYCRNCRSWVKHPYVRDVNYYLNERHPANESGCSYHARLNPVPGDKKDGKSQTLGGVRTSGRTGNVSGNNWQPQNGRSANAHGYETRTAVPVSEERPNKPQKTRKGKNTGILVAIAVIIVFRLMGSCASHGLDALNTIAAKSLPREYDVDLGDFSGESETWEADYIELEDEEVIAAGVECSREIHFAVSAAELQEPLSEILEKRGLAVTGNNTYSFNERYDDGDTWYVTWIVYDLNDGENGAYQYAELDYDTATEALHQIDITLEDPQVLGNVSGDVIEMLEENGALIPGENCAALLREEMPQMLEQSGYYSFQSGALYIDGGFEEDNYTISIYRRQD